MRRALVRLETLIYSEEVLRARLAGEFRGALTGRGSAARPMKPSRYLVAGPVRLDCRDERLWRDGRPVALGGKALAFLRTLMERPKTLVTKDELFEAVWPGLTVSESVLTTAAKEVRQALGDDARNPALVQTVHGRGYRFLLDVDASDEPPAAAGLPSPQPGRRRLILWAAIGVLLALAAAGAVLLRPAPPAAATSAANAKSIAVLPFEDLSPGGDQQWFAAGLTEEILNSLARTPDLHVAARSSTRQVTSGDVREIGRRLSVAHILEGSVRRDGGRVRVTAQLIRTSDGFHLWSQNFDRRASDVVSIQEDIAVAIAHALDTVMSPDRLQEMVRLGTRSVDAYEAYLRGLANEQLGLETGDQKHRRLAGEAFERARTLDPGFAAAHWEAAQFWFGNATRVGVGATESRGEADERLRQYLARVDAAIEASAGRPENLRYRSARASVQLELRQALRLMRAYLRERPRDIDAWEDLVDLAAYADDRRLMAAAAGRIHTLSIESGAPRSRALTASVLSLDTGNAVGRARRQLALRPGEALIQYQAHRALLWGGHRDEARAILERLRTGAMPAENKLLAEIRQACADGRGDARRFVEALDRLPGASMSARWQALTIAGDEPRATALLRPLDRPERLSTLMQFLVYPNFDSRAFPLLHARLRADGIERAPPVPIPFGCRPRR